MKITESGYRAWLIKRPTARFHRRAPLCCPLARYIQRDHGVHADVWPWVWNEFTSDDIVPHSMPRWAREQVIKVDASTHCYITAAQALKLLDEKP